MNNKERLPIQVVIPREKDYSANKPGGSKKFLCPYTEELRLNFENQCKSLQLSFKDSFEQFPATPCIGKVVMKEKAIAKSHKPTALFKSSTCPIIGTERLNEVLIKVTPQGLNHLINNVKSASTKDVKINLTKIQNIVPYSITDKIAIENFDSISAISKPIKVKLFAFDDEADNQYFTRGFEKLLDQLGLQNQFSKPIYGENLNIYKIKCIEKEKINLIAAYPGVRKISFFPHYACDFPNIISAGKQIENLPMPTEGVDYPIIGIIDSGISKNNKYLEPWVYKREIYVGEEFQNNDHGTFVAGIVEFGNILNGGVKQEHFKLLDVVIFPNGDKEKGAMDTLTEDTLIENLHDVIGRYCDKVKVWNMSLGTDQICCDIISDLAVALDGIQDMYGVELIISAGNYTQPPLRSWPPKDFLGDKDRITAPADSVRAVTVGSIANESISNFVDKGMPSPFSRKGPGANFLVKPEVVYYGGNCEGDLSCAGTGVVSFDIDGNLVEGIGTSYSTPFIATLYATIRNSVIEDNSREYAKAFLIHAANVPECAKNEVAEYNKYFGYGLPSNSIEDIIACSKYSVTLVFSGTLFDGSFIEFNDFPYPKSLNKEGKCFGDIKMTLAYTPKLNSNYGQEYCRANIDAHFGTYDDISPKGDVQGFKGMVPLEKKWDEKYEASQVENGFKWNPIKSYHKSMKGIKARPWRLRVDSCARLGDDYDGQKFVLLITITDPNDNDIYSEVIQMLRERGYIYNDIKIQNKIRQAIGI